MKKEDIRQIKRVQLTAKLSTRDATLSKGGLLTNCYSEKTSKVEQVVKRPGFSFQGVWGNACQAQGAFFWNGRLLFVGCDTLWDQKYLAMKGNVAMKSPGGSPGDSGSISPSPQPAAGNLIWRMENNGKIVQYTTLGAATGKVATVSGAQNIDMIFAHGQIWALSAPLAGTTLILERIDPVTLTNSLVINTGSFGSGEYGLAATANGAMIGWNDGTHIDIRIFDSAGAPAFSDLLPLANFTSLRGIVATPGKLYVVGMPHTVFPANQGCVIYTDAPGYAVISELTEAATFNTPSIVVCLDTSNGNLYESFTYANFSSGNNEGYIASSPNGVGWAYTLIEPSMASTAVLPRIPVSTSLGLVEFRLNTGITLGGAALSSYVIDGTTPAVNFVWDGGSKVWFNSTTGLASLNLSTGSVTIVAASEITNGPIALQFSTLGSPAEILSSRSISHSNGF